MSDLYGPKKVADLLGVSVSTVQRWSDQLAGHLSDHAKPPAGGRRAFTEADVDVFRRAKAMLSAGLTYDKVNAQLSIVEEEPEEASEEAQAWQEGPIKGAQTAQETADSMPSPGRALVVLQSHDRLLADQAGQVADLRARVTQQDGQIAGQRETIADQAREIADLRERLARIEEAQRQQERRRFRWPWQRPTE